MKDKLELHESPNYEENRRICIKIAVAKNIELEENHEKPPESIKDIADALIKRFIKVAD